MEHEDAYRELLALYRERVLLESISTTLGWDEETYMPAGGVALRAEQHALLAGLEHARAGDDRMGELLAIAEQATWPPDAIELVDLRVLRREHDQARATPASLVEELAHATTLAQGVWEQARARRDLTDYLPALARVVELTQAWADCVRGAGSRYDACLDDWEPDLREADVVAVLAALQPRLRALVDQVEPLANDDVATILERPVARDVQHALGLEVVRWLGFDLSRGRLDEATHPSTMWLGPGDVRLTTRYDEDRPFAALYATLHELGHGLYDQNLPVARFGTPAGEARSVAIHEALARLLENVIGKSRAFVELALPELQARAPIFAGLSVDQVYRALNNVRRSPERVSADEVTYDLHIAIRVEIERALISGGLAVADLPDAWDAAYARDLVLGGAGLLQDGHWAAGMFGYFPTYTLGNVIAAHLEHAMRAALPALDAQIVRGELAPAIGWLTDTIHQHGARFSRTALLDRVLGRPVEGEFYVARLEAKYRALYVT
jgi:carboxypeptidase Taq